MEICVTFKIFIIFIFLQQACVWTENNDISERLSRLEDMLTEMENIVRESDVKVRKAQDKLEGTQETLERDFTRLQKSKERKMRKGHRKIMKEVRNEFKNDNRFIKEMIQSVKYIHLKGADNQERNWNNITSGLKSFNGLLDESQYQEYQGYQYTALSEGNFSFITESSVLYKCILVYQIPIEFFFHYLQTRFFCITVIHFH